MKKLKLFWLLLLLKICPFCYVYAGITFSGPGARFAITPGARLYLGEVKSISGWTRESIVQSNGENSPLYWEPYWVDGSDVIYEVAPEAFSPKNEGDIFTDENVISYLSNEITRIYNKINNIWLPSCARAQNRRIIPTINH